MRDRHGTTNVNDDEQLPAAFRSEKSTGDPCLADVYRKQDTIATDRQPDMEKIYDDAYDFLIFFRKRKMSEANERYVSSDIRNII